MDEAGLPEEEQESLKVLHYYLEGTCHICVWSIRERGANQ